MSTNTTVTISINGAAVTIQDDGEGGYYFPSVTLGSYASSVSVSVVRDDQNASVTIDGVSGDSKTVTVTEGSDNTITVVVTAADATTTNTIIGTVDVPAPSNDTGVTITVDGSEVTIGGEAFTATLTSYTASVVVAATATDTNATVTVTRSGTTSSDSFSISDLVAGSNSVTVTVTAEDTGVVRTITGTITVPSPALSSDNTLSTFTVNGGDNLNLGDTENIDSGTTSVTVIAIPTDSNVTSITIGSTLTGVATVTDYAAGRSVTVAEGSNTITVVVTAEDGTTETYTITAYVFSNVKTLSAFTINGTSMGTSGGGSITVANGTTSASVSATATNSNAFVTITSSTGYNGGQTTSSSTTTVTGLTTGTNTVTVTVAPEDESATATYTATIYVQSASSSSSVTCFEANTKILCFNTETSQEEYVTVQNLRKGHLVKTVAAGYKAIDMIGKREIEHNAVEERIKNQLYKCSNDKYPEIFEDLVITGCHCILVKGFVSDEQKAKTVELNGDIYITDNHYRVPTCLDEKSSVYETVGTYTIYHFALENDDYYMNYGVYANGLLVETCSKRYLKEISEMDLIE